MPMVPSPLWSTTSKRSALPLLLPPSWRAARRGEAGEVERFFLLEEGQAACGEDQLEALEVGGKERAAYVHTLAASQATSHSSSASATQAVRRHAVRAAFAVAMHAPSLLP